MNEDTVVVGAWGTDVKRVNEGTRKEREWLFIYYYYLTQLQKKW